MEKNLEGGHSHCYAKLGSGCIERRVGTCWIVDISNEDGVKKALEIPQKARVIVMTPLGYPAEKKGPVTNRKSLGEIVHYEQW